MTDKILNELKAELEARKPEEWPNEECAPALWVMGCSVQVGRLAQCVMRDDPELCRKLLIELGATCVMATKSFARWLPEAEGETKAAE